MLVSMTLVTTSAVLRQPGIGTEKRGANDATSVPTRVSAGEA